MACPASSHAGITDPCLDSLHIGRLYWLLKRLRSDNLEVRQSAMNDLANPSSDFRNSRLVFERINCIANNLSGNYGETETERARILLEKIWPNKIFQSSVQPASAAAPAAALNRQAQTASTAAPASRAERDQGSSGCILS